MENAYTTKRERSEDPDPGFGTRIYLDVVDTDGVIHAAGLRIRSLLLSLQTLAFSVH